MENKVAIIGLSLALPKAHTINEFFDVLKNGIDCVDQIDLRRLELLGMDPSFTYQKSGTLTPIDEFDYSFFNISKFEAEYMDPQMRYNLMLATQAIENSGYRLKDFYGSDTAVYTIASDAEYYNHFSENPPIALTGNHPGMYAGRVAHFLNLHGPAIVLNTLCSSFLVALHEASVKIKVGEVQMALVGGLDLMKSFNTTGSKDPLNINSEDDKCKPFDEDANGIVGSEGGGYIVLKSLNDAIADNDTILAVISGSAVNQDGATSNGITSPSPLAQAKVISKAWEIAKIDLTQIDYIETHGSGTKLGDAIEFEALNSAFENIDVQKSSCPIGSVKSNIGHIGNMAGFAGLLKSILTIQHKTIFPSLHFNFPNKFLNYHASKMYVNTALTQISQDKLAIVGISSFGLSGTNAHLVLEEHKNQTLSYKQEVNGIVKFSAKSKKSVLKYINKFIELLMTNKNTDVNEICYAQNKCRDDYQYRVAFVFDNTKDLLQQLTDVKETDIKDNLDADREIIFYFPSADNTSLKMADVFLNGTYKVYVDQCLKIANENYSEWNLFTMQYALYKLLESYGITADKIMGNGIGKIVTSVILNEISLEQAFEKIKSKDIDVTELNHQKFNAYIEELSETKNLTIIEFNNDLSIVKTLNNKQNTHVKCCSVFGENNESFLANVLATLFEIGYDIQYSEVYNHPINKMNLPTYQFDNESCWIYKKTFSSEIIEQEIIQDEILLPIQSLETEVTETEFALIQMWGNAFKKDKLSIYDDFYELGGNSLMGIKISNLIRSKFKVNFQIENILFYSTINRLAAYIDLLEAYTFSTILPAIKQDNYELSNAQMRIWLVDKYENFKSNTYNLTTPFEIKDINIEILIRAVISVIERHEILRSNFIEVLGRPRQIINEEFDFSPEFIDLRSSTNQAEEIDQILIKQQNTLFDLESDLLIRITVVQLEDNKHILILNAHHIIIDLWSLKIIINELVYIYKLYFDNKSNDLPALQLNYKDFAAWQNALLNSHQSEVHKNYWLNKIPNTIESINYNTDYSRPEEFSYNGNRLEGSITDQELIVRLRETEKESKVTAFMLWQSILKIFLYKLTDSNSIVIGSPFTNRPMIEFDNQVGLYLDTIPLYDTIEGTNSFVDILEKVKTTTLEAFEHQIYPLDFIINDLKLNRDSSRSNPLFDVMMVYVKAEVDIEVKEEMIIKEFVSESTDLISRFDIIFYISEYNDTIKINLEYNTDLYKSSTINQMIESIISLTRQLVDSNNISLDQIDSDNKRNARIMNYEDENSFNF